MIRRYLEGYIQHFWYILQGSINFLKVIKSPRYKDTHKTYCLIYCPNLLCGFTSLFPIVIRGYLIEMLIHFLGSFISRQQSPPVIPGNLHAWYEDTCTGKRIRSDRTDSWHNTSCLDTCRATHGRASRILCSDRSSAYADPHRSSETCHGTR